LIGKLICLIVTRLDITFTVGVLSRYMQSLYQLHRTTACRILRYLKRAPGKGLYYHPSSQLDIVRYSDDDWVGGPINCCSTNGYCTFVGDNLMTDDVKNKMLLLDPVLRLSIKP